MSKTLAVCVAVLLAITLVPQSASAGTGDFGDAAGDVTGVARADLTSITVQNHRTKVVLDVRYRVPNSAGMSVDGPQSWWSVFLETNSRRPGPEWRVHFGYETPLQVSPVVRRTVKHPRRWNPHHPRKGVCARPVTMKVRKNLVRVVIPKWKGCFTAKGLRVHARARSFMGQLHGSGATVTDELPNGARALSRWVKVGTSVTVKDRTDRVNWWNDIRRVSVGHTSNRFGVSVRHLPKQRFFGMVDTYLDTNADGSPDWLVWVGDAGGGRGLLPMSGWGQVIGEGSIPCDDFHGEIASGGRATSTFSLPTSCIGSPSSVRVAVSAGQLADGQHHPLDWLGGARRWSAPVTAR